MKPNKKLILITSLISLIFIPNFQSKRITEVKTYITNPQLKIIEDDRTLAYGLEPEPIYPKPFKEIMKEINAPEKDWKGLYYIFSQESGICGLKWEGQTSCPTTYEEIHNPSEHIGYGVCQATPAIKYDEEGSDWRTNIITQAKWCYKYALSYGSIANAENFKKCTGSCYSSRTSSTIYKHTPWF